MENMITILSRFVADAVWCCMDCSRVVYTFPNGNVMTLALTREPGRATWIKRRDYAFNGSPLYWHRTAYDAEGRPTETEDSLTATRQWLYNRRSELVGASGTQAYPYDYAYSYDADGNLTQDDRFTYSYDDENRLVSVTPLNPYPFNAVVNAYDHRNRRIRKDVWGYHEGDWRYQETHTFVWDGWNIVLEQITNGDQVIHPIEYFWGNDFSGAEEGAGGVGGLLATQIDGVFYIPVYGGNGNIMMYVDETGTVAAQFDYDPYGRVFVAPNYWENLWNFGFSTKYHDWETDLVAYQLRTYDSLHGRWLNRDPIEEEGGVNLYAFCNNCQFLADRFGLSTAPTNPFFKSGAPRFPILKYIDVEAREFQCYNAMGDFFSFVPGQERELPRYVYSINFIVRFTPPLDSPQLPYSGQGRNALGGYDRMFRIDPKRGDVPKAVWGNGEYDHSVYSIVHLLLEETYSFPKSKVAFGYFVYIAANENSPFELIFENDSMYSKWSRGLEKLRSNDKYFRGFRTPCEIVEIQYGDRGCGEPKRVQFKGRYGGTK